jgi:hypothetical protein
LQRDSAIRAPEARIFRDVRQGFRHHEVGHGLDRLGQPCVKAGGNPDGNGGPFRQRLHRRGQALLGEDRRMDSARELAQLVDRPLELRAARAHIEDPRTVMLPMLYFTAWGRKPG